MRADGSLGMPSVEKVHLVTVGDIDPLWVETVWWDTDNVYPPYEDSERYWRLSSRYGGTLVLPPETRVYPVVDEDGQTFLRVEFVGPVLKVVDLARSDVEVEGPEA